MLNTVIYNALNRTLCSFTHKNIAGINNNVSTNKIFVCKYTTCVKKPKPKRKVYSNSLDAIQDISDGAKVLIGGFGLCGIPENLIRALSERQIKNLTVIANNVSTDRHGFGTLLKQKQIKRFISSFIDESSVFEKQFKAGEIELELTPQGTLVERLRAGGAGIPAFFTPTAYGTLIQEGGAAIKYNAKGEVEIQSAQRQVQLFNGKPYLLEEAIYGDFALIKAQKGDTAGNLVFSKAARNFNPTMAKAAKLTIAEVEELVEVGEIDPDEVHLPGIYVDRIFKGEAYTKKCEIITVAPLGSKVESIVKKNPGMVARERIIRRLALEFKDGMYVNLGIGLPMMAANYIPEGVDVFLHSENGVLGLGPHPNPNCVNPDLINAGKETVTVIPGASFFSSTESFEMIHGGHLDMAVLSAMEVSQYGDLANWMKPGEVVKGISASMDIVAVPRTKIVVCMEHNDKDGGHKIVSSCTLPLTGSKCVDMIITEKAVFDVDPEGGLTLTEVADGVHIEDVLVSTGCDFKVAEQIKPMGQYRKPLEKKQPEYDGSLQKKAGQNDL